MGEEFPRDGKRSRLTRCWSLVTCVSLFVSRVTGHEAPAKRLEKKMTTTSIKFPWEASAAGKYQRMIEKIPLFHREIARQVVDKKAVLLAQERGALQVEEADIVRAFFSEVPMTFYSLMIRLLQDADFDYQRYEPK